MFFRKHIFILYLFKQSEIVHELNIEKPSIYRIVLRYVNPNNETIVGLVSITPETPNNINVEQKFMVNKTYTFYSVIIFINRYIP